MKNARHQTTAASALSKRHSNANMRRAKTFNAKEMK